MLLVSVVAAHAPRAHPAGPGVLAGYHESCLPGWIAAMTHDCLGITPGAVCVLAQPGVLAGYHPGGRGGQGRAGH